MAFLAQHKDIKTKEQVKTPAEAAKWLLNNYAERYVPTTADNNGVSKLQTWCNIFFTDVVQLLKLPGPFHWVDLKGNPLLFQPGTAVKGTELSANGLVNWFNKYGHGFGWIKVTKAEALQHAQNNKLVGVTFHSGTNHSSGHIAVLLADGTIAQAGRTVFYGRSIQAGFGDKPVEYWVYVEQKE